MQKSCFSGINKTKKNQALLSIITANNTTLLMVIIKIEHSNKIPQTDF